MRRVPLAAVCLLLLPLPGRADDKSFTIPFEMLKTQHMVVRVTINGKGPYRLIFDTGAPDSLVSNKVLKEAGLTPKAANQPMFGPFGARGQYTIKTLEAGDLKADNVSAMVIDHPTVGAIGGVAGPLEGILGFTFFARYRTTIDYEKGRLTLTPVDFVPGDVLQTLLKKFTAPRPQREAGPVLAPAGLLGLRVTKAADDAEPGVTVAAVLPESPAAAAGLKAGDRLLTLDGRWTDSVTDCYLAAGQLRPGTAAAAAVLRDGRKHTLTVTARPGL